MGPIWIHNDALVVGSSVSEVSHATSERCSVLLMVGRAGAISAPADQIVLRKHCLLGCCRQRVPADLSPADQWPLREAVLVPYVGAFRHDQPATTHQILALNDCTSLFVSMIW